MNILSWIIFGALAGAITNIIDPHPARGGAIGAIVLGILGALLGGLLANLFFGVTVTGFNLTSFIIAVLGSLLILSVQRLFMNRAED
jgi:uncharacterized membrane protein YeaQ/YmgE (transglycosylase-associated protein family)